MDGGQSFADRYQPVNAYGGGDGHYAAIDQTNDKIYYQREVNTCVPQNPQGCAVPAA